MACNNIFIESRTQSVDDRGISRNYRLGTAYEKRLRDLKPLEEPWKSYGERLRQQFGYKTVLWSDVLDPAWQPESPHGCAMINNVAIASGDFKKPKTGDVTIRDNISLPRVEDAGFFNYALMDLRTDNPRILEKFPELNEIFPKIGLHTDSYRIRAVTRQEVGGLVNRGSEGSLLNEDISGR